MISSIGSLELYPPPGITLLGRLQLYFSPRYYFFGGWG